MIFGVMRFKVIWINQTLADILKAYGYRNLYAIGTYYHRNWTKMESYKNYLGEIKNLRNAPYVRKSVCALDVCLHITGPREIKTKSSCLN